MSEVLCAYGCGNVGIFVLNNGKYCCSVKANKCPSIRKKNAEGLKRAYKEGKKQPVFTETDRNASNENSILCAIEKHFSFPSDITNAWISEKLVNFFKVPYICSECKIDEWNNKPIVLDLDHINGLSNDNRYLNLRFLCPNCHSQTETYRGKNINNGKVKVADSVLYNTYKECGNIRKTLLKCGLAAKGGNYERMYRIINNAERPCEFESRPGHQ